MKNTQGPWEFVPGEDNEDDTENSVGSIKGGAQGASHLARVWADGPNPEGDGRIMAAAPDLLAALQMLYAETVDYIRMNNLGGMDNQCMRLARAALAKVDRAA